MNVSSRHAQSAVLHGCPNESLLRPNAIGPDRPLKVSSRPAEPRPKALRHKKKDSEWHAHRSAITELYQHQGKTLKQVIEFMKDHYQFVATEKMYKMRIKKWGLDKKNKESEVIHMLHVRKERGDVGKSSKFLIRNRAVDWNDVERYLKRRPDLLAKFARGKIEIGSATTAVICRTPSPNPVVTLSVPRKLNETGPEHVPEKILICVRNYFDGAFDAALWSHYSNGFLYGPGGLDARHRACRWFATLYTVNHWTGPKADAVRLLNALMDDVALLAKEQDVCLISFLFAVCHHLGNMDGHVMCAFARFAVGMFTEVLGRYHPLTRMLVYFQGDMQTPLRHRTEELIMKAHIRCLDAWQGLLGLKTLEVLRDRVTHKEGVQATETLPLVSAKARASPSGERPDRRFGEARFLWCLGRMYIEGADFSQTEQVLGQIELWLASQRKWLVSQQQLVGTSAELEIWLDETHYNAWNYWWMATKLYLQAGRLQQAISAAETLYGLSTKTWGLEDALTRLALHNLLVIRAERCKALGVANLWRPKLMKAESAILAQVVDGRVAAV